MWNPKQSNTDNNGIQGLKDTRVREIPVLRLNPRNPCSLTPYRFTVLADSVLSHTDEF